MTEIDIPAIRDTLAEAVGDEIIALRERVAELERSEALNGWVCQNCGTRLEPYLPEQLSVIDRQCGPDRSDSPEELHEDWVRAYLKMGWKLGATYDPTTKTHPDMVPYADLGQLEQDKDAVFVALCEIARLWIRDGD